jgi:hypothetical protein
MIDCEVDTGAIPVEHKVENSTIVMKIQLAYDKGRLTYGYYSALRSCDGPTFENRHFIARVNAVYNVLVISAF